jgi:uncharacterized protein YcfL
MPAMFKFPRLGAAVLMLLGISVVLPGCGSTYRASKLTRAPLEDREKVVYKDMSLKQNLGVMDIIQDQVNGMLRVRGKVKNLGRGLLSAEVKVKFIDKDGMEIGEGAPWTPLPIEGGEIRTFEGLASSPQAVDYRILIQLAGSH